MAIQYFDAPSILAAALSRPMIQIISSEFPEAGLDAVAVHNHVFNLNLQSFKEIQDNHLSLYIMMILECYPNLAISPDKLQLDSAGLIGLFGKMVDFHTGTFAIPSYCNFQTHLRANQQIKAANNKYSTVTSLHDSGIY